MTIPSCIRSSLINMCDEVSSPISLRVKQLLQEDRWDELAGMRVQPEAYATAYSYYLDVCVVDYLRKCEDLDTTVDRKAAAVENFWKAERQCFVANKRLDAYLLSYDLEEFGGVGRVIRAMQKFLVSLLGKAPSVVDGKFGKGATYGDRGRLTTLPHKMASYPTFTSAAVYSLVAWTSTAWARACAADDRQADCVRGNRFTTVPKDCLKDRGICVEPSINLFYQLGFGQALKKRLATQGLLLEKAQGIHRQVACDASKTGAFATIDLSNASDTICKNLVKLLLPPDWFSQLDDLRSAYTEIEKDRWVLLEKFSSMGNGFTFELETAIFLAICQGAAFMNGRTLSPHKDVWVYGDDIIVPTDLAPDVITLLRYFGLTPNEEKTFLKGSFRESCGGDFFDGQAVRPYYLKKFPNEPQEYIAVANGLRRLGSYNLDADIHTGLFRRAWFRILDAIPSDVRRCRGPVHLGDLVIHDDATRWNVRLRRGIRYFRVYRPAKFNYIAWRRFHPEVTLACALYGISSYDPVNWKVRRALEVDPRDAVTPGGVIPRGGVRGYKVGWTPYS